MSRLQPLVGILSLFALPTAAIAQCSLSNATGCVCRTTGQTHCELLPDLSISAYAIQSYGPQEFPQTGAGGNNGHLRVSGSTPNTGYGPLEVRGATSGGVRAFICGPDTLTVAASQQNFTCPNGFQPRQMLYQRIYSKNGGQMTYVDEMTGTMTYHPSHSHYHVDDWTTMTLRLQGPPGSHPLDWPIVTTGAKMGYCLMDLSTCQSSSGHCRTSQTGPWNGAYGSNLNSNSHFPNWGLDGNYTCSQNYQGISVGHTDIYSQSLDGMWINLFPNLCNGNYWIVLEVDPQNVFREEDDTNNWTAVPFSLTQQRPSGSGGAGNILCSGRPVVAPGAPVTLTAIPGTAYQWTNGATTRSITVSQPGTYGCTVTTPCGTINAGSVTVSALEAPAAPVGTGDLLYGPGTAQLHASGQGELVWYDAPTGGNELGIGEAFDTPVIDNTTSYWVGGRNVLPAEEISAGRPNSSGGASQLFNERQWMLFDAYEPFTLKSVKVYSGSVGQRHFVLVDQLGNLIAEKHVEIPAGEIVVDLDFNVPKGTQHKFTAYYDAELSSGNAQVIAQNLRGNTSGVSYPYAIGAVGSITGSTMGSSRYLFFYDWKVERGEVVAHGPRTEVVAQVQESVVFPLKVALEGPYNGAEGSMNDALRMQGLVPLTEPFTTSGYTHHGGGGEQMSPALLSVTGPDAIVDWVLVELRSGVAPAQVVATKSALLKRSGHVVAHDGGALRFPVQHGSYHVAVRHRNHLGAMTAAPLALDHQSAAVDFTSAALPTWGSNARKQEGGVMLLWAGNVHRDNKVTYTGMDNDRDPILTRVGGVVPTNSANGYHPEDVNLDGNVRYTGLNNDRDPILINIGGVVPTQIRIEQLP